MKLEETLRNLYADWVLSGADVTKFAEPHRISVQDASDLLTMGKKYFDAYIGKESLSDEELQAGADFYDRITD
jgi:hypothetical protein